MWAVCLLPEIALTVVDNGEGLLPNDHYCPLVLPQLQLTQPRDDPRAVGPLQVPISLTPLKSQFCYVMH